jgi:hypothetical protein
MQRTNVWLVGVVVGVAGVRAWAQTPTEIGFVEEFALATNRAAAIQQLVPGTDDYYRTSTPPASRHHSSPTTAWPRPPLVNQRSAVSRTRRSSGWQPSR